MFSVSHCRQQPRTRVLLIQSDPTQAPFQDKPQIFWLSTRTWICGFKCVEALLSGRINELLSLINTWRSPVLFHNSDTVNNSKHNSRGSEVTSLWSKALQGSRCSPTAVPENSRQVIYWQADSTCKQRQEPHPSNNMCLWITVQDSNSCFWQCGRIGGTWFVCKLQKSEASKLEKHPGGNTGRENQKPAVKYLLVETQCVRDLWQLMLCFEMPLFWNNRQEVCQD